MDYKGLTHGGMSVEEAEKATILRCVVGSQAYGTSIDDPNCGTCGHHGHDHGEHIGTGCNKCDCYTKGGFKVMGGDRDEMGVMLEPLITHLSTDFEQFVWRDAEKREGRHNAKSQPGDLDLKLYTLWKFTRLALNGNPDVLMLLFTKPLKSDARGMGLQGLKEKFLSREAIPRFKGYLYNNRQRLMGQKGQKDTHRPDLIAKYGFDTKYAMQMVRLGLQGLELVKDGKISMPMQEVHRKLCIEIRTGGMPEDLCLRIAEELEQEIEASAEKSPLPKKPDREAVWEWAARTYLEHWKCTDFGWRDSIPNLRNSKTLVPEAPEGGEL